MRIVAALIALTMLGGTDLMGPARATAQESPDPSECQVEPRDDAWLLDLIATPVVDVASPPWLPSTPVPADELPEGEPAGPDTLFGINETMRELVACVNAGETRRALALLSNDATRETVVVLFGVATVAGPLPAATPTPLPADEQFPFFSIRDPRVLEDGRVGAIVSDDTWEDYAFFIIFVEQDGRWLVDEAFATEAGSAAGP
ncbi:MAG: hypothetical protein ACRDJW_09770 [Thermomicrobiales bacterium]